ncbi:borealin isoform X2 [Pituophis catenifer annectens]|uniref:borealin isoform X2 n=1 Tax=Pituophis catenifer annectens TaxID=94852 RepID=UPI003991BD9E
MAHGKKRPTARGAPKASALNKRVDAFLKDFDREVRARLAQVRAAGESLKKDVENLSNMEVLRLPLALRKMNWVAFLALGGSDKALEQVASVKRGGHRGDHPAGLQGHPDALPDRQERPLLSSGIHSMTALVHLPSGLLMRISKQAIETIDEEMETSLLPAGKKSRQENQAAVDPEVAPQKPGKVQTSTKRPPNSKRTRPPSSRAKNFRKRLSKVNPITPASQGNPTKAATPLFTPAGKFDSSVFRTPGLRAPAAHERVFSISVNGSPLADRSEVFLTVPLGGGENVRIRASELSERDLTGLSAQALGSVKKLSSQLVHLCNRLGSHK